MTSPFCSSDVWCARACRIQRRCPMHVWKLWWLPVTSMLGTQLVVPPVVPQYRNSLHLMLMQPAHHAVGMAVLQHTRYKPLQQLLVDCSGMQIPSLSPTQFMKTYASSSKVPGYCFLVTSLLKPTPCRVLESIPCMPVHAEAGT